MSGPSPDIRVVKRLGRVASGYSEDFAVARQLRICGLQQARKIKTFTTRGELASLMQLALECPEGSRAIEVGSYLGASTCYLGAGLSAVGGTLTCVDTWQNETMPEGNLDTMSEFERNVKPIRKLIHVIRKSSVDLGDADVTPPYDLGFLDGDHSYQAVRSDYLKVSKWIAKDGILAFHDCKFFQGVSRVVGEALATGEWRLEGHRNNLVWLRRYTFIQ